MMTDKDQTPEPANDAAPQAEGAQGANAMAATASPIPPS